MVVSSLTVEEMIAGWPYPELPLITAEPTYEDIATMQKRINAKFLSTPSNAGGGRHGHLGLLMTTGKYNAISPILLGQPQTQAPWPLSCLALTTSSHPTWYECTMRRTGLSTLT
jgi:hypothetical protein